MRTGTRLLLLLLPAFATAAAPAARLTPDGYGPLRIGMTKAQVTRLMGPDAQPRAVGGPDPAVCDEYRPRRAPDGMVVMLEKGRLSRISLHRGAVATDRGIRIGDAVARVRSAYRGQRLADGPHTYVDPPARYLTWTRAGHGATRGIRYEIDDRRRVSAIHADGAAIRYVEGCL